MSIILIGCNGMCLCQAHTKCIKGKISSSLKCTKEEIKAEGYTVIAAASSRSQSKIDNLLMSGSHNRIEKLRLKSAPDD